MNNDYYLEQIAQNTDNTEVYTQSIMGDLVALRYELAKYQEINQSGDIIIQEEIQEVNQSVTLVAIVVILLVLLNFVERCFK